MEICMRNLWLLLTAMVALTTVNGFANDSDEDRSASVEVTSSETENDSEGNTDSGSQEAVN
jgi:hypothetical protein